TESQLLGQQKFAALGRMSAGIAHDFNNLLTTINLGAQELAFPDLSEADREALIAAIVQACERGAGITRQLQASSAAQLSRPELVDLGELVAKDLGVWRTLAGAEVRVEGVLPDEALPVRVDPAQFHRVLLNLVVNACQAMGESGELTLSAGRRGPGEVFVSVADTGGGIPPSVAERMFEPFFTTRETGTGLGLAVVRGVVVQAGGSIDYALAGGGTIFTVVLPEADPNETPPDDPFGRSGPRSAFSRVALVDGDPAIRQIVQRQLERMGHEVRSFAAPGELLAGESHYDLLIAAIELPGLSGPELALGLREARRIHRVLLLGGTVSERARESLDKLADAPVLPKPFGAGELGQVLERMLSD
ncbi:multi-sensor hybrid histidine kinase, partial [Plesiocystis pacifica SIR-1]